LRDIEIKSFIKSLESLPDHRDNRGKRHELPFVLCSVVLAILSDRSTLSSIHRYIENRIGFLRRVTGYSSARVISRAQLPRILASVDRAGLSERTMCHFDIFIEPCADNGEEEWYGGDGKSLRGTADEQGEQKARTFLFVGHDSRDIVVQCEMNSNKEGEIIVARHLLEKNGLASLKITLDALHLNPETTALIALAGGEYLIQAKANQPILYETLIQVAQNNSPFATVSDSARGHGRQEERHTWLFNLQDVELDPRWRQSNINTLAVVPISLLKIAPLQIQRHKMFIRQFDDIGRLKSSIGFEMLLFKRTKYTLNTIALLKPWPPSVLLPFDFYKNLNVLIAKLLLRLSLTHLTFSLSSYDKLPFYEKALLPM